MAEEIERPIEDAWEAFALETMWSSATPENLAVHRSGFFGGFAAGYRFARDHPPEPGFQQNAKVRIELKAESASLRGLREVWENPRIRMRSLKRRKERG